MKFRNTTLSRRTLALLAATALLFAGGGFAGTRAALTYFSEDYTAAFELDHLHVHLIENGKDVCHDKNSMTTVHSHDNGDAKDPKYRGNLLEESLGYSNPEGDDSHYSTKAAYKLGTPGEAEPGRTYKEEISARNGSKDIDQYVRLTIRKYWVNNAGTAEASKNTALSPDLIRLSYNGEDFNSSAWAVNKDEHSDESDTYYLKTKLGAGKDSALLFNELTIDESIAEEGNMDVNESVKNVDGREVTVYTYTYDYNGCTFYIEADVQAIQTHNVNDAITSLWGVDNVSASNGTVTVK